VGPDCEVARARGVWPLMAEREATRQAITQNVSSDLFIRIWGDRIVQLVTGDCRAKGLRLMPFELDRFSH